MVLGSMMLIKSPAPFMRISLPTIVLTTGATAAFFIFLVTMALRAQRQQTTTGAEGLIGQIGTARTSLRPEGMVFVEGELWSAQCEEGAEPGDKVRVRALKGLMLFVSKDQGTVDVEADTMSTRRQPGGQA